MEGDDASLQFADLQGETLIKNPGSINGESFCLKNLSDCSVFLLDYTSEVEVTNCTNCQIFIGPVDGPAIFGNNKNCNVAVASQQFQAKACHDCNFGLYCATAPSLSNCSGIVIACWNGAYAGLSAHFAAANLDPTKNQWANVYDASATDNAPANFQLSPVPAPAWEVPVEGAEGPAENPVPTSAPPAAAAAAAAEEETAPAPDPEVQQIIPEDSYEKHHAAAFPSENGGSAPQPTPTVVNDTAADADAHARLQTRLAAQAKEESEKKAELQADASRYLEEFYAQRNASKDARISSSRDDLRQKAPSAEDMGPKGNTLWERAVSLIDFNMARPNGTDLSRFKTVLMACKERGAGAGGAAM